MSPDNNTPERGIDTRPKQIRYGQDEADAIQQRRKEKLSRLAESGVVNIDPHTARNLGNIATLPQQTNQIPDNEIKH